MNAESVRPPGDDSAGTKERLLGTAERLFAEHGISEVSLRDITRDAGANLAAVNYHFGSKEGLVLAVFTRRIGPLNERRLSRLDAAEESAGEAAPPIEAILEAFVAPAVVAVSEGGGRDFMRLMGRAHTEASPEMRRLVFSQFEGVLARFVEAIRRSLPHLGPVDAVIRLKLSIGAMAMALSDAPVPGARNLPPSKMLAHLVAFLAAGFRAETS